MKVKFDKKNIEVSISIMEELKNLFDEQYSDNTIKTHLSNISRLYHHCNCKEGDEQLKPEFRIQPESVQDIHDQLSDCEYVIEIIKSMKGAISTKANYFESVKQVLLAMSYEIQTEQSIYDTYLKEHTTLREDLEIDKAKNPKKTRLTRENVNKILEVFEKDYGKSQNDSKNYIIIKICSLFPFRNETGTLERITMDNYNKLPESELLSRNFLITGSKMHFSFGNYKTDSKYGVRLIDVIGDLKDRLNEYCDSYIEEGGFMFFSGSRKQVYNPDDSIETIHNRQRNNFTLFVKRLIRDNKKLIELNVNITASPTDFAKLLIKEALDKKSPEELKKLAKQRGHSIKTSIDSYAL